MVQQYPHAQRTLRRGALGFFTAALTLTAPAGAAPQDPTRDLRSKDPEVREAAVVALTEAGGDKVEKNLVKVLKDKDWLVLLRAIEGLREHGTDDAAKPLLKLATEGPFRAARDTAARALASAAPAKALDDLIGDLRGRNAEPAVRALAELLVAGATPDADQSDDLEKRLGKLLESEEGSEGVYAASAWVARVAPDERAGAFQALEGAANLEQRARALETLTRLAAERPEAKDLALAGGLLARRGLEPVLERRALALARAALASLPDADARARAFEGNVLDALRDSPDGLARAARVIEGAAELFPRAKVQGWIERLCGHDSADVRAAAAKALRAVASEVGEEAAARFALQGANSDSSPRVRLQHVLTASALGALALGGDDEVNGPRTFAKLAMSDSDPRVREAAAIALGAPERGEVELDALIAATADREWEVAVSATVALGKTRDDRAVAHLTTLAEHDDWRVRGAAAVGLYQVARAEAVPALLAMLDDENPSVATTAHRAFLLHSGREGEEVEPDTWDDWWEESGDRVRFQTPDEVRERRERYGYSVPDREIYKGLDVVVVPGRGDLMENVLERLGISHRTALAGRLGDAGLHPFAILVAGCTGELEQRDLDVVRWYVRCGGALFTSCWALTHTVDASFPGLVTKFPSPGEVLDRVTATPVAPDSPYLTNIFDGGDAGHVVPVYELEGAHLIQVLDPERVEVLVDSPAAAMRHGSGALTAWFRAGHGVVLDSVNHFDLQGLMAATELDGDEEFKAWAVDHMGYTLQQLRETAKERWWRSRSDAAENVDDLSAFRILTNFVREKRINGG